MTFIIEEKEKEGWGCHFFDLFSKIEGRKKDVEKEKSQKDH